MKNKIVIKDNFRKFDYFSDLLHQTYIDKQIDKDSLANTIKVLTDVLKNGLQLNETQEKIFLEFKGLLVEMIDDLNVDTTFTLYKLDRDNKKTSRKKLDFNDFSRMGINGGLWFTLKYRTGRNISIATTDVFDEYLECQEKERNNSYFEYEDLYLSREIDKTWFIGDYDFCKICKKAKELKIFFLD